MNKIKSILISFICLSTFVSCSGDGLNRYRKNGQLVDLDYSAFDEKITNHDSFVFMLTRNGCHACKNFYPIVSEFLEENEDKKIYTLNCSNLEPVEQFVIVSYFTSALGSDYYEDNGYDTSVLYTPAICKVVKGESKEAEIGTLSKEEIGYLYQDNYASLDTYYSYNQKVQDHETFNLFVSKNGDDQYDGLLRQYFTNNSNLKGYYLNTNNFDDDEDTRLLDRINYYLGENNIIEELPDYYLLQYENGVIVNYVEKQYDVSLLDTLFNKN